MTRLSTKLFLVLVALLGCWSHPLFGQTTEPQTTPETKVDTRTARDLFQDADSYLHRRFQEFNKQKLPFDPAIEPKTREEQKQLAAKNAQILEQHPSLHSDDLFYLGRLFHMAGNSDKAYEYMKQFLLNRPGGENAQIARIILVVHAIKINRIPEAEMVTEEYATNQPLNLQELYGMELLLTKEMDRIKNYAGMAHHAKSMMAAARRVIEKKEVNLFKRDEMLFTAASLLADAQLNLKDKESAIATVQELGSTALWLPSGNLYYFAKAKLAALDSGVSLTTESPKSTAPNSGLAPDLVAEQWIDREPTKLSSLHGQVVLLDFWAPWCGPCLRTFPKLQKWYETYKDRGLVIVGVTNYYGNVDGKKLTPGEELAYLKSFKNRRRVSYGFAISDSSINDRNYGVTSIPMSFLIDRQGKIRFISIGASDAETAILGNMVKQLVEEGGDDKATTGLTTQKDSGAIQPE